MATEFASRSRIQWLSRGLCNPGDTRSLIRFLVPFVVAGLRAPGTLAQAGAVPCARRLNKEKAR